MKKILSAFIFLLASFPLMGATVRLHGKIAGLPQGVVLTVKEYVGDTWEERRGLTRYMDGVFSIMLNVEKSGFFVLQPNGIDNAKIYIMVEANDQDLELSGTYLEEYKYIRIESSSGSKNMLLYQKFNAEICAHLAEFARLNTVSRDQTISEERKKVIEKETWRLQLKQRRNIKQLILNNSDCLMAAFLVTYFDDYMPYIDVLEKVSLSLKKKYSDNMFVSLITKAAADSMAESYMAPEIAIKDRNGVVRKLSSLRGKVVLINFCASWCGPCRKEMPLVVDLYKKYHDKGFDIYSVALEDDRDRWLNYVDTSGQVWENIVSELNKWKCSAATEYKLGSIPHSVLVDRKGRIIARGLRGEAMERKVEEVLGE